MVLSELLIGNSRLLGSVVLRVEDLFIPPLVAAGRGEHAAHQMEMPVRMREAVKRRMAIRRNKMIR